MANKRIKKSAQTLSIKDELPIGIEIEFPEFNRSKRERPIKIIIQENGCYNCTSHKTHGFGYCSLKRGGRTQILHRYIYTMCKGSIPEGLVVRHTCDNPQCINPAHLIVGTHSDNVKDRMERGRSAIGERNGRSKLTEEQVVEIKTETEATIIQLARRYSVDPKTIRLIQHGKLWKHVQARVSAAA